mmetsp:Transcript_9380/g.23097  ORF Transcript_9380/g.23097 Transcript_9380/m.23097 type:complete len:81 (+) Transcript_9380:928-1170(+)
MQTMREFTVAALCKQNGRFSPTGIPIVRRIVFTLVFCSLFLSHKQGDDGSAKEEGEEEYCAAYLDERRELGALCIVDGEW